MGRKKRKTQLTYLHRPIPEPPEKNFGTGLLFLAASFFNNTQSFNLEVQDGSSRFTLDYKGFGYQEPYYKRRKNKKCTYQSLH